MIERQGRQRARARLPARAARADRRLGRVDRPHRRARPRGGRRPRCSTCRAAARSRPRTPRPREARGEVLAFSDANAFWEPDALRRLVAPFADPRGRLRLRPAALRRRRRSNQEGAYWRYEMAVRELESGLGGITAGNGGIYAVRRDAYMRSTRAQPRPLVPVQPRQAGLRARVRARRGRRGAHGADDRGRVRAQAPDDERRLGHRPARRDAVAARLRAAVRVRDLLAPRCCATRRRCCTWSRWRPTSPCSGEGVGLRP